MSESPSPKPPSRRLVTEIIKRYVKEGTTPVWSREIPVFYHLWADYPSLRFWLHHELPFKLNSICWFRTEEGKERLASDWLVFFFTFKESEPEVAPLVDKPEDGDYHIPTTPSRAKTLAQFLKGDTNH